MCVCMHAFWKMQRGALHFKVDAFLFLTSKSKTHIMQWEDQIIKVLLCLTSPITFLLYVFIGFKYGSSSCSYRPLFSLLLFIDGLRAAEGYSRVFSCSCRAWASCISVICEEYSPESRNTCIINKCLLPQTSAQTKGAEKKNLAYKQH